ncbi:hypothetical protein [Marinomonas spartinae]|uniref:hypothetical protein n=1 Tax=Marinomonas spartinae TaxID=1792290 RepID=UPI0018F1ED55|nr:hypothetical protein [Marinomonas spartinae]MBJ7555140.1 hypothetical protein [Marinomonas spartinae]
MKPKAFRGKGLVQLNEQKQLPATSADTAVLETEKYKLINNIVTSMKLSSNPVVLPASDLNDMVQAIRMYQQQIAQLRTPDWVNDNVDHIKEYANRTFLDDWPMPKHK